MCILMRNYYIKDIPKDVAEEFGGVEHVNALYERLCDYVFVGYRYIEYPERKAWYEAVRNCDMFTRWENDRNNYITVLHHELFQAYCDIDHEIKFRIKECTAHIAYLTKQFDDHTQSANQLLIYGKRLKQVRMDLKRFYQYRGRLQNSFSKEDIAVLRKLKSSDLYLMHILPNVVDARAVRTEKNLEYYRKQKEAAEESHRKAMAARLRDSQKDLTKLRTEAEWHDINYTVSLETHELVPEKDHLGFNLITGKDLLYRLIPGKEKKIVKEEVVIKEDKKPEVIPEYYKEPKPSMWERIKTWLMKDNKDYYRMED